MNAEFFDKTGDGKINSWGYKFLDDFIDVRKKNGMNVDEAIEYFIDRWNAGNMFRLACVESDDALDEVLDYIRTHY